MHDPRRHRVGRRPRARRAARPRPRRPPPHLRRRRRTRHPAAAGLPAPVALRPIGPVAGGRTGPRARRLPRAPSVDRAVVGPRRPDAQLDAPAARPAPRGRRRTIEAAFVGRAAAADLEQVGARPLGEALVRTSRPDPVHRRALRRRAAPPAARRHRQPPVVRMAPRRGGRPRHLRPPHSRAWSASSASSVPTRCRRRTRSSTTRSPTATWPDLDWERLADANGYDLDTFERLFPPSSFNSFAEWRNTTQYYQSHVLKVQIETLRKLKYRPTGGFCFSSLADPAPIVSSSVLDHERVPKDAYEVVRGRLRSPAGRRRAAARLGEPGRSAQPRRAPRERPADADRLRRRRRHRELGRRRAALALRWPDPCRRRRQGRRDRPRRARHARRAGHRIVDDRAPPRRHQPLHHRRHPPPT